jgi:hypothetical protein
MDRIVLKIHLEQLAIEDPGAQTTCCKTAEELPLSKASPL